MHVDQRPSVQAGRTAFPRPGPPSHSPSIPKGICCCFKGFWIQWVLGKDGCEAQSLHFYVTLVQEDNTIVTAKVLGPPGTGAP